MKMKRSFYFALLLIGLCLIGASLFFRGEETKILSGILIGVGAGLFGMSVSGLVVKTIEQKNPEFVRQSDIDYKDERNTMIRNRAKATAGDITQWLIIAIAWLTIIISAPLWLTLAVMSVYLSYNVIGLYLMSKYQKEM